MTCSARRRFLIEETRRVFLYAQVCAVFLHRGSVLERSARRRLQYRLYSSEQQRHRRASPSTSCRFCCQALPAARGQRLFFGLRQLFDLLRALSRAFVPVHTSRRQTKARRADRAFIITSPLRFAAAVNTSGRQTRSNSSNRVQAAVRRLAGRPVCGRCRSAAVLVCAVNSAFIHS